MVHIASGGGWTPLGLHFVINFVPNVHGQNFPGAVEGKKASGLVAPVFYRQRGPVGCIEL